jgi:hypothetical protein
LEKVSDFLPPPCFATTTQVDGNWLPELGPMFFSVKENFKERLERQTREKLNSEKMAAELQEKEENEAAEKAAEEARALAQACGCTHMHRHTLT